MVTIIYIELKNTKLVMLLWQNTILLLLLIKSDTFQLNVSRGQHMLSDFNKVFMKKGGTNKHLHPQLYSCWKNTK